MASYPAAIKSFLQLEDGVDTILAAHPNDRGDEITAIETELGINVAGSAATLLARLTVALEDDGTLKAASVSQPVLKTATASDTQDFPNGGANTTLGGGEYSFFPQFKRNSGSNYDIYGPEEQDQSNTSFAAVVRIDGAGGTTNVTVKNRYVSASGRDPWVFLKIAKRDFLNDDPTPKQYQKGAMIGVWYAPDHPSYGRDATEIEVPHPFEGYNPVNEEIVLIDNAILSEIRSKATRRRGITQVIFEEYLVDENSNPVFSPREIVEIDEYGDKSGEVIGRFKTPEFAKIIIGTEEITLKRRMVQSLPTEIRYKSLKIK